MNIYSNFDYVKKGIILLFLAGSLLYGCGSNHSPDSSGSGNTGTSSTGEKTVSSLLQATYTFVSDSNGKGAKSGTTVEMFFQPNGIATLFVANSSDALSYHGSWSYNGSSLHLKFDGSDFHPNVTFPLNLSSSTVKFPFQVFSTSNGSSTWDQTYTGLDEATTMVFEADASDSANPPDEKTAIIDSYKYILARLKVDRSSGDNVGANLTGVSSGSTQNSVNLISAGTSCYDTCGLPSISSVSQTPDGIIINYSDGTQGEILLASWQSPPTSGTPLSPSSLVNDPRIHLIPNPPHDPVDDPKSKTAFIFAPFNDSKFIGLYTGGGHSELSFDVHSNFGQYDNLPLVKKELEQDGYNVEEALDSDVTVENLIKYLGSGSTPGIVVASTHGTSDGYLATGVWLGSSASAGHKSYEALMNKLKGEGYASLTTQKDAFRMVDAPQDGMMKGHDAAYLAIGPGFWEWLESSKGADFSDSLVIIDACSTDATGYLREAIQAKAYFAFNVEVDSDLGGATLRYIVAAMSKYTHSTEETYYNMIRISSKAQEIYKEDTIFQGTDVGVLASQLDAWGYDGTTEINYANNGWLSGKMNAGQIWWLLFAGRWNPDVNIGAKNLADCYSSYWAAGNVGGLANVYCTNADAGSAPTQGEVGYATYLLTGTPLEGISVTKVPRLTLHD